MMLLVMGMTSQGKLEAKMKDDSLSQQQQRRKPLSLSRSGRRIEVQTGRRVTSRGQLNTESDEKPVTTKHKANEAVNLGGFHNNNS